MSDLKDSFYNRATSAIPISVGSSLALESIFVGDRPSIDPSRKPPAKIALKKYPFVYFNLATLLRNIVNAANLKADQMSKLDDQLLYDILYGEVDVIRSIFKHEGGQLSTPVFYASSNKNKYFETLAKYKSLRELRGGVGQAVLTIDKVINKITNHNTGEFVFTNDTASDLSNAQPSIVFTHQTYDLLSYKFFTQGLYLLESHTGQLKDRAHWNTKYFKMKDDLQTSVLRLPFNKYLLALLGDNNQIKPYDIKVRREIVSVAKKFNWTPVSTEEKVYINLKQHFTDSSLKTLITEL